MRARDRRVARVPALARVARAAAARCALGIGGLFGFHFLLFLALRLAPPVEANLVNYLWPLLIVRADAAAAAGLDASRGAMSPAALAGFAGAALAIGVAPATHRRARRIGLRARRGLGADVGAATRC